MCLVSASRIPTPTSGRCDMIFWLSSFPLLLSWSSTSLSYRFFSLSFADYSSSSLSKVQSCHNRDRGIGAINRPGPPRLISQHHRGVCTPFSVNRMFCQTLLREKYSTICEHPLWRPSSIHYHLWIKTHSILRPGKRLGRRGFRLSFSKSESQIHDRKRNRPRKCSGPSWFHLLSRSSVLSILGAADSSSK